MPEYDVTFTDSRIYSRTVSFDESYITIDASETGKNISIKPGGLVLDNSGNANWKIALPFHISGAEFSGGNGTSMTLSIQFLSYKNESNIGFGVDKITGPIKIWIAE